MATLRKATPQDYAAVRPLFDHFGGERGSHDYWKNLFQPSRVPEHDTLGYLLESEGNVVGFLATTFSQRHINGRDHVFCNTSNWVVLESHRHESLKLMMPALKLKNVTLTNFTPTPDVLAMCRKLGFRDLDGRQRIFLPSFVRKSGVEIVASAKAIASQVSEAQAACVRDHALSFHRHLLVRAGKDDCLVILNRTPKRLAPGLRVPFARAHYISNPRVFAQHAGRIAADCMGRFGVGGLIAEERTLQDEPRPWNSFLRPNYPLVACYTSDSLDPHHIDALYSELVLLNY